MPGRRMHASIMRSSTHFARGFTWGLGKTAGR